MDDRGVPRRLRGVTTAGLATLVVAVGHVLAGGAVPDLAVLVVLFPLLTGGVVGIADRCRSTAGMLAVLAGGQLALHLLLALLHPHAAAAGPDTSTMIALHAAATVVVAVLLHHADRAVAAAGSALRRVLALRRACAPPADAPLPSLRIAVAAPQPRRRALAAVPARRGPPVGC
jgi:hypothetical protein